MQKYLKKAYYLSIFLVGMPPIFLFLSYINTHTLAKLIWLFSFLLIGGGFYRIAKLKINKSLLGLFLLYFLSQSVSIIAAQNVGAFLERYEDFFFSSIFFVLSGFIIKDIKDIRKIILVFFVAASVNVFFQALIYISSDFFVSLGSTFLHGGFLELISINIQRGRVYFNSYDEALIPIIIYLYSNAKGKKRWALLIFLIMISSFAFISNFRTRFLMLIAGLVGTFAVFSRKALKYLPAIIVLPFIFFILYSVLIQSAGFTVVERVLLKHEREDVGTITGRIERWNKAAEIGLSSPIFGVGLGNYYDYLDFSMKRSFSLFKQTSKEFEFAAPHPHNIFFKLFAETGILGLAAFLALLFYFIKRDWGILRSNNDLAKALVVSFWTLFLHSLFNPSFTTKYQAFFWLLRILIERASLTRSYYNGIKLNTPRLCLRRDFI